MLTTEGVTIGNVTFEPGCRNNWHIHHAQQGGEQILLCTAVRGYYQEWGKEAQCSELSNSILEEKQSSLPVHSMGAVPVSQKA